jgi:hypothetical protein
MVIHQTKTFTKLTQNKVLRFFRRNTENETPTTLNSPSLFPLLQTPQLTHQIKTLDSPKFS